MCAKHINNHYSLIKIHKIFIAVSFAQKNIILVLSEMEFGRSIKVYIDFIIISHLTCHKPTNTELPVNFVFPCLFSVTNGTIGFSLFPWIWWYKIYPKKSAFIVPKYILQSVVYPSGQSCARHHAKPSNFSIFDSTHFFESNGI